MSQSVETPAVAPPASTPSLASDVTKVAPATEKVAAPAAAEAPAPTAKEIRKLKLKLEGADIELPEEDVIKLAQQASVANRRFQDAAMSRKETEAVLKMLKENPKVAMEKLGIDLRKFSEETLTEIIKREQESPAAKKERELEEKVRSYEAKEAERAEEAKRAELVREESKKREAATAEERAQITRLDKLFTKALEDSGVPKTPWSIARMAQLQRVSNKNGWEMPAEQLAKIAREDYDKEFQERVSGYKGADGALDGDKLISLFGEDIIKAITKAKVKQLKSANPKFSKPAESQTEAPPAQDRGSWREFTKRKRNMGV